MVTAWLDIGSDIVSVECRVNGGPWQDCSTGEIIFTGLDSARTEPFRIEARGCLASNPRYVSLTRRFYVGTISDCRAHLINDGITVDLTTDTVTFNWQATGPAASAGLDAECILRRVTGFVPCSNPHSFSISGVSSGRYAIAIRFNDPFGIVCTQENGAQFKFVIPLPTPPPPP